MKDNKKKKVFVGVSGGVDSSVSAALLVREGYDVTGVFMKVWQPDFIECTWREERHDAMRVCAHLGIPFLMMDFEREYKEGVAEYMIREYKAGRTPNPDVMCNREVKFGAFYRKARELGADFIATGHYAIHDEIDDQHLLRVSKDAHKDQTYFLWAMPRDAFEHTLFPVGGYTKDTVRNLARKYTLPTAEKKDSQGVCFLGKLDMKEFLSHYIPKQPGVVLDTNGNEIGTHQGAVFFTLGERHGFEITRKGDGDTPLYVIGKDLEKNTITVADTPQKNTAENKNTLVLSSVNWLSVMPEAGKQYQVRIRYHGELYLCECGEISDSRTVLHFVGSVPLVAPGQSAVIYDGDVCLGGGVVG